MNNNNAMLKFKNIRTEKYKRKLVWREKEVGWNKTSISFETEILNHINDISFFVQSRL